MRILSLDVGTKTIGVAVSDELGITANGITTIKRSDIKSDLKNLKDIIDRYSPAEIVIGVPYNIDGSVGNRGKDILTFSDTVKKEFSIPVVYWDESFSTVNAEEKMLEADLSRKKRKKVIDKMAAVIILQEYLACKQD